MKAKFSPLTTAAAMVFIFAAFCGSAAASTYKVLHVFRGHPAKWPQAGLVADSQGNLYGTTGNGSHHNACQSGCGVVFELRKQPNGDWKYFNLYGFRGGSDGNFPTGELIIDSSGNLYGTTVVGGGGACSQAQEGCGTVFELSPSPTGWTEQILYRFDGTTGALPSGGLVLNSAGNLYGTTAQGGTGNCTNGCGTVFELVRNGNQWTHSVLYNFQGTDTHDGSDPISTLTFDSLGNLYGTTLAGGDKGACRPDGCGTVFELTPLGGGNWAEEVLHSFNLADGYAPKGALTFDAAGNLLGTTEAGGKYSGIYGVAFMLSPSPTGWTETILHHFGLQPDASSPEGMLVSDGAGNFFGLGSQGGKATSCQRGCGALFKLSPAQGGKWKETVIFSFDGYHGLGPIGNLVRDVSGILYGVTLSGGKPGKGVVYKFTQ